MICLITNSKPQTYHLFLLFYASANDNLSNICLDIYTFISSFGVVFFHWKCSTFKVLRTFFFPHKIFLDYNDIYTSYLVFDQ